MDLYFAPLACSMATRIAIYEAGADARFIEVDTKAKRILDGGDDYLAINPIGYVPALRTDDGAVLTENAAILQYVASRFPAADLAPTDGIARARLQAWLSFVGTELHKGLFIPLLDRRAPEGAKTYAMEKYRPRLDYLNDYLSGREFLLDRFSVADAYGAELVARDHDRFRRMAGAEELFQPYAAAAQYRARTRGGRRALRQAAGAQQGGLMFHSRHGGAVTTPRRHPRDPGRRASRCAAVSGSAWRGRPIRRRRALSLRSTTPRRATPAGAAGSRRLSRLPAW
jgi:glutathione S-transferase